MAAAPARTALVTGASRGIGRAIAIRLGREAMTVAVHYGHDRQCAEDAVKAVESAGGRAFAVRAPLDEPDGVDVLFDELEHLLPRHAGTSALDVLVNNAGVGCRAPIEQLTPAQLDRALAVNVRAPVFVTQRALALLRDGGRIVNISSVASRAAHPAIIGYAVSKGALDAFGRSLAAHLEPRGITVNTVAPGLIETGLHRGATAPRPDQTRVGEPLDVAEAVAFLVSAGARWITGQRLEATGGGYL